MPGIIGAEALELEGVELWGKQKQARMGRGAGHGGQSWEQRSVARACRASCVHLRAEGPCSLRVSPMPQLCVCIFKKLIYFLAALGLCCCMQAFSSCGEQGLLFVAVRGL